jgi:hypothetical protein
VPDGELDNELFREGEPGQAEDEDSQLLIS